MNKKNERDAELEQFKKEIKKYSQKDFDGHTDFSKLTVRQKLDWLSQLISFKEKVKRNN